MAILSLIRFDDDTNIIDLTGRAWTKYGSWFTSVAGKFGTGLRIQGISYVSTNLNALPKKFTLECFIQTFRSANFSFGLGGASFTIVPWDDRYLLLGNANNYTWDNVYGSSPGSCAILEGSLHHLALTYDIDTLIGKLYVDGTLRSTTATFTPNSTLVKFGNCTDSSYSSYKDSANMYIDEVRVSDSILYTASFTPPAKPFAYTTKTLSPLTHHIYYGSNMSSNYPMG